MSRVWKVAITEALAGHDALRKELIQAQVETEFARKETTDVAASLEANLTARDERITALEAQSPKPKAQSVGLAAEPGARPKSIQLNISDLVYAVNTSSERPGCWPKA